MRPSLQIVPAVPAGTLPETLPYHNTFSLPSPGTTAAAFVPPRDCSFSPETLTFWHIPKAVVKFPSPTLQLKVSAVPSSSKANESLSNFSANAP